MSLTILYTDSRAAELDVEREIIRPDALLTEDLLETDEGGAK